MKNRIKRILIVEDEILLRIYIKRILSCLGEFEYLETASGTEAVTLAREQFPHLILMDIKLTDGLTGFEAARAICRDQPIPVIFMSAYDYADQVNSAEWPCPVRFYSKPVLEDDVRDFLHTLGRQG